MQWTSKVLALLLLALGGLTVGCRADAPRADAVGAGRAASIDDCSWRPSPSSPGTLLEDARALVQILEDGRHCVTDAYRRRIAGDSGAMRYVADVVAGREPGVAERALWWMAEGARPEQWPDFAAGIDRRTRLHPCCLERARAYGLARFAHHSADARARLDRAADSAGFDVGELAWTLALVNDSASRAVLRRLREGGRLADSVAPDMGEIVDSVLAWPALPPGEGRVCVEDQRPGRTGSGAFGCVPATAVARTIRVLRAPDLDYPILTLDDGAAMRVSAQARALRVQWGPVVHIRLDAASRIGSVNLAADSLDQFIAEVTRLRARAYLSWSSDRASSRQVLAGAHGAPDRGALVVARRSFVGRPWELTVWSGDAYSTPRVRLSEWQMASVLGLLRAAARQAHAYEAESPWPNRGTAP